RRHTRSYGDWSSDVCSSDLLHPVEPDLPADPRGAEGRGLPVVLDPAQIVLFGIKAEGLDRPEVEGDDIVGRRLEEDLELVILARSEERRVGKEGRSRREREH